MFLTIEDDPKLYTISMPVTFVLTLAAYNESSVHKELARIAERVQDYPVLYMVAGGQSYIRMEVRADPDHDLIKTAKIRQTSLPYATVPSAYDSQHSRFRALDKPCPDCHGLDTECGCKKPHNFEPNTELLASRYLEYDEEPDYDEDHDEENYYEDEDHDDE